jgi:hypothetical protein
MNKYLVFLVILLLTAVSFAPKAKALTVAELMAAQNIQTIGTSAVNSTDITLLTMPDSSADTVPVDPSLQWFTASVASQYNAMSDDNTTIPADILAHYQN